MAKVLVDFDVVLRGPDDRTYSARACGRERPDGLWEGWLEFPSLDGGDTVRTGRETTQPNHDDVHYWATGLTDPYLDGALLRTLQPPRPAQRREPTPDRPAFDGPAPHAARDDAASRPQAILDPFRVYAEGDDVLRGQLHALSEGQLRNIIRAFDLDDATLHELEHLARQPLIDTIMRAMESQPSRG